MFVFLISHRFLSVKGGDDEPRKNKKGMRKECEEQERKVRSIRKDVGRRMRSSILRVEMVFRVL